MVHVYREGNRCANALARWGSNMAKVFAVFDNPPSPDVMYLVNMDNVGMFVNRITELDLTSLGDSLYFVFPLNQKEKKKRNRGRRFLPFFGPI